MLFKGLNNLIPVATLQSVCYYYLHVTKETNGKGNGNQLQCSCLENPKTEVHGVTRVGQDLVTKPPPPPPRKPRYTAVKSLVPRHTAMKWQGRSWSPGGLHQHSRLEAGVSREQEHSNGDLCKSRGDQPHPVQPSQIPHRCLDPLFWLQMSLDSDPISVPCWPW